MSLTLFRTRLLPSPSRPGLTPVELILRFPLLPLLLLLAVVSGWSARAEDWPQWRGPRRDGTFHGPQWPGQLDTNHLQLSWRVECGPSYSGPIIVSNRVFTTATKDGKLEEVLALDRQTGKTLWRTGWQGAVSVPFFAKSNGDWIRGTPACDGERLFVPGMRDVLVCLSVADGKELWRCDFVDRLQTPLPDFGLVCSPLIHGDFVYLQAGAGFAKLSKSEGEILWRTLIDKGGMWGSAFSSPILVQIAGKQQLLVQTRTRLAGVDPDTGAVLWEQAIEAFRGMNILTPVVQGDLLLTSTYGGRTIAFKVTEKDGKFTVAEAWRHKAQGYMSTPVVVDGVAYHHLKSQRAMAVDFATGKELWTTDQSFGKYWSMAVQGDRILALDERGILLLFRANKQKFDLLDQRKLADTDTWAHVAPSEDQLFIRELRAMTAYRWRP